MSRDGRGSKVPNAVEILLEISTAWVGCTRVTNRQTTANSERERNFTFTKNSVVRYWHGYLSGARCKWFAYGPADATATPSSLAPVKSRMVYLSGAALPRLSWNRPLNGRSSISSCMCKSVCNMQFQVIFTLIQWPLCQENLGKLALER